VARLRERGRFSEDPTRDDDPLKGVPQEVLDRVTAALSPGSPENPFEPGFLQARNHLLWLFFIMTGGRRAEIRAAKVADVEYATRLLHIRESKTMPRSVPIGELAADAFDAFIAQHWGLLSKNARKQGFLFTDEHGDQISLRQVNRVFERIRVKVPEVPDFLTPHTARRSWNDRFSEMVDGLPPHKRMSPEKETLTRNRLQGWTPNSEMGAPYAKRHIAKRANELGEALANEIAPSKRRRTHE
jgi:integrase